MDERTKQMVQGWLKMHHGDHEGLARWMRANLHLGGIKVCRALILEALAE